MLAVLSWVGFVFCACAVAVPEPFAGTKQKQLNSGTHTMIIACIGFIVQFLGKCFLALHGKARGELVTRGYSEQKMESSYCAALGSIQNNPQPLPSKSS